MYLVTYATCSEHISDASSKYISFSCLVSVYSHSLTITCTCCYDVIHGIPRPQDLFSCSFSVDEASGFQGLNGDFRTAARYIEAPMALKMAMLLPCLAVFAATLIIIRIRFNENAEEKLTNKKPDLSGAGEC